MLKRVAALGLLSAAGCGGGTECLASVNVDCAPLYQPTFTELHTRTISQVCAASGCHTPAALSGGMSLAGIDEAYQALTDPSHGPRARAGDPACSLLLVRIESDQAGTMMPPGRPLSEAERCVFRKWVADGAQR